MDFNKDVKFYDVDFRVSYSSFVNLFISLFCSTLILVVSFIIFYFLVSRIFVFSLVFLVILIYFAYLFYVACSVIFYKFDLFFASDFRKEMDSFIKSFCETNNLVDLRVDNVVFSKRYHLSRKVNVVEYCPNVSYAYINNIFCVRFRLDGSRRSVKYTDYREQLDNLFRAKCVDVKVERGFVYYIFDLEGTKQFSYSSLQSEGTNIFISDNLYWDFRRCPHGLVVGGTGSGKTYFLSYLILQFLKLGCDINILDPKRSDMSFLNKYLGDKVQFETNYIIKNLRLANEEMTKRYDDMRNSDNYKFGNDFFDYGMKSLILIFDEVSAFMSTLDKKQKEEVNRYLSDIIMKGRQAGVFIIFTMQRADTEFIKGAIRDQLGFRVALGSNMSNAGLRMCFEDDYKELGGLEPCKGAGYVYIDGFTKNATDFIAPYLDVDFIQEFEKLVNYREEKEKVDI